MIDEEIREKFGKVQELLDEQENVNAYNEPYKNKYKAIELLKEIKAALENASEECPFRLAIVHLKLGILYVNTEELQVGEKELMACIKLLEGQEMIWKYILPAISALNELGFIWSQWSESLKAQLYLEQAEQMYKDYIDLQEPREDPVSMNYYFQVLDKGGTSSRKQLEELHTLTLYYLAQVYSSLEEYEKSTIYCHMTLSRQLGKSEISKKLDYITWALNTASLSQYFIEKTENFSQARYHLAAATYILQKYEEILKKRSENEESESLSAEWENFKHRNADVARCWSKYGIALLCSSKRRLIELADKDENVKQSEIDSNTEEKQSSLEVLKFELLEGNLDAITAKITDKYLLDFSDARPVFLQTLCWLEDAKKYYTLENHATDHAQIAQDMSQAFKYLSFFEENEERQAKMHKRRVNILENVVNKLNPQYYQAYCRQIWFELGETYADILTIKLDRLTDSEEKPTHQQVFKINHLIKNAISNFQTFIDSVKSKDSDVIPEDVLQCTLHAYFYIGRLYSKIVTPDVALQIENTQKSLNAYQFVLDYCEKHAEAAEVMKTILSNCKELVFLLSAKLGRLQQETIT